MGKSDDGDEKRGRMRVAVIAGITPTTKENDQQPSKMPSLSVSLRLRVGVESLSLHRRV